MLYTTALVAALAAVAQAVQFDLDSNNPIVMKEGEPLTLNWSGAQGAVTINLVDGPSTDLNTVFAITTDRTENSFTWTPEGIPSGTYAFEIVDESGDTNYTPQYTYQGTGTIATATADDETSTAAPTSTAEPTESETAAETTEPATTEEPTTMATMTSGVSNSTTSADVSSTSSLESTPTADEANDSSETDIVNANSGARFGASLTAAVGVAAVFAFLN